MRDMVGCGADRRPVIIDFPSVADIDFRITKILRTR